MRAVLLAVSILALAGGLLATVVALSTPDRWRAVAPHHTVLTAAWTLTMAVGVPILLGAAPRAPWAVAALVVGAALGWFDGERHECRVTEGVLLTGGASSVGLLVGLGSVVLSVGIITEAVWLVSAGLLVTWTAATFMATRWLHDRQLVRRHPPRLEPPRPLHCTHCGAALVTPDRCVTCGIVPTQHCPWCGASRPAGSVTCPACGRPLTPPSLDGRSTALCLRCGADLNPAVHHCWRCGEQAPLSCPGCGLPVLAGDDYCHSCDLPLVWS
jgi:hypothetical protein